MKRHRFYCNIHGMSAKIIDGKSIASGIKQRVARQVAERVARNRPAPSLAVILVGDHPASLSYVGHKQKACSETGILSHCHRLPETATQQEIARMIDACNQDPTVHGILLQLPLPLSIQSEALLGRIDPQKDVDGFHPLNIGYLALRQPKLRPCTPYGVMQLLAATGEKIAGLHAVVLGASNIVGRPMALELLLAKCTTTVCHRFSKSLAPYVESADILISATGKTGLVQSEWIKKGAIVVDIGFNHLPSGKIVGDIEFETARQRAGWITPVPGGVGPMTVAMLLANTLTAAEMQDKL